MALLRKLFNKKPPEGLLEISERIYAFDCCFSMDILEEKEYNTYIEGIASKLRDHFRDASFMVFNFREGESQSQISCILSEYDMTVMDYPRQYEGCPLLTTEMIHHFLKSSESWFSLGQQNMILLHCERDGWPVLAFMLTALLLYRKQHSGEQKTLDMIYKQAPRELLHLMSPLNPLPSQVRYLRYVSRRNVGSEWPPTDKALTLDCIILRSIPNIDGKGGCCPIFRIYGQDPFMPADRTPKVLFSTPKHSKFVRHYKKVDCELVKVNIDCHVVGDVVLECINLDGDREQESMIFRIMFNTAFIRSSIMMLNREEIDILWNAKDQFPKDFRAEVIFSDMDVATSDISIDLPGIEGKDGLPIDGFAQFQEICSKFDYTNVGNMLQENLKAGCAEGMERASDLHDVTVKEKSNLEESDHIIASPTSDALQQSAPPKIISQRVTQSSISSPVSYGNSFQGSPVPISRYCSAPSALGITALLHDHDVSESEDRSHPVEDSDSTPSSALEVSPPTAKCSSQSPPHPPPPPPLHSFSRASSSPLVQNSLQSLPASSSASLAPKVAPPPPPPLSNVASSTSFSVSSSPQLRTSGPPPPPPPPPPLQPGSISNITSKPSVPQPPPPPPPLKSGSISNITSKPSVPQPPPPPPPSLAPKGPSANVPPVPPPPAPFAKGLSKAGDTSPQLESVSNGNIPSIPGPPSLNWKGRSISRTDPKNLPQARKTNLKPYHWLKLTRALQGSLWAEAQKPEEASKTPEIDMSELESLFSTAASNSDDSCRKSNRGASGRKPEKVQLIELRRAYNCEIMLTKVKIPLPDLTSSVLALDDTTLDADQLENLIKFCPTKEEAELLKGYRGDKEKLGKCEQLFLELIKVPRIESKLRVFLFKIQFSSQVSDLRKSLNIVNSTSEEVRNSVKLKRIMQTILSLGNALNRGTARGSAVGFRLDSLLKLTETRAQNNKMTLMHYLCKVLVEKLPELLYFPKDLATLEASTKIQLKCLAEEMQAISKGLEKVVQELTASRNDGPVSETYCSTLQDFLGFAETEVRSLASLYSSAGRNADALALYFGEDPARCTFEQVVSTLLNFVRMFVRAHEENCKQLELEKRKAQQETENEKLKVSTPRKKSERLK